MDNIDQAYYGEDEAIVLAELKEEAQKKQLNVFLFKDDDLRKVYPNADQNIGLALLARDKDSADWNLKNLRRVRLVRYKTDSVEQVEAVESEVH